MIFELSVRQGYSNKKWRFFIHFNDGCCVAGALRHDSKERAIAAGRRQAQELARKYHNNKIKVEG